MAEALLNVGKSSLTEFLDDLEAKLAMLTGLVNMDEIGLRLQDVRKPVLVIGDPGMGKTCGVMSVIEKINLKLPQSKKLGFKKILLGQTVVGDMQGIPVKTDNGSIVRVQVPDLPDVERDGEYGVLFLDEITTADEAQVQPALGLADDSRNIGEYTLPEHWLLVAGGNGPNCSNFVRLDDMTISRFAVYDISYDYVQDFLPYAQSHKLSDDVIAFLNFSPDSCMRVESNELDENGKLFACPRTWERLSTELRMREALGKPIGVNQIGRFSSRIIGLNAAREFEAFERCVEHLRVSPQDVINGKAEPPTAHMKKEEFFMILQKCNKLCLNLCDAEEDGTMDFSETVYTAVGNMVTWFIAFAEFDLEAAVNAFIQIRHGDARIKNIIGDTDFDPFCPGLTEFMENYGDTILNNLTALEAMN